MEEDKKKFLGAMLFFGMLLMVVSSRFLGGDHVLMTTDAIISGGSRMGSDAVRLFPPSWRDYLLLGLPAPGAMQVPTILKVFTPAIVWNNLTYIFACFLTAVAGMYYLRQKIRTVAGWVFFGIASAWVGSNFTLLYAGHGFKPYVVLFFVCSLIPVGQVVSGSLSAALVWGGCVGLMFAQQPDVALFFALFSGAYLVFRLWQGRGFTPLGWLKVLIPAMMMCFLFAAGPLLTGYEQQVKGAEQMQTENKQEKWEYVTQWSFPPEESVAFIAPGYTGWRSGEPDGPYWGRMGRSAGWEQTRQGFQNFKLENTYLGVVPVAFALFALFSCRRSKHRAEIVFWGSAALVSLLLAFGKYTPIYALFYQLPVVNNIRNPNKFLQVFQVALALLSAYGVDALFRCPASENSKKTGDENGCVRAKGFFWCLVCALGVIAIGAVGVSLGRSDDVAHFVALGWPRQAAEVIAQNKMAALWHLFFMATTVTGVFAVFAFPRLDKILRHRGALAFVLILLVAWDAVNLSRHYVKEMPKSYIQANALTDFLKSSIGQERVALVSQQGIYGIWLTYLLPYNQIPAFNFAQMSRMPQDYQQLLDAGSKNPLRMWRFSGVKYVLGPSSVGAQLPPNVLRKVFAYDVAPAADNEFKVIPSPTGAHAVFEFIQPIPRYVLVGRGVDESNEQILARLADGRARLPGDNPVAGSIDVLKYRPGRVEIAVKANEPCMLRAAERWDANWKATVDGQSVEVQRIDFICQGVSVPAGSHQMVLSYSPPLHFFYMQCLGYLVLIGALVLKRISKHEKN